MCPIATASMEVVNVPVLITEAAAIMHFPESISESRFLSQEVLRHTPWMSKESVARPLNNYGWRPT